MQTLHKLLQVLNDAERQDSILDLDGTVSVLLALQKISSEKKHLEKTIQLLFQLDRKAFQLEKLSKRESEIFYWIGLGCSSREIGALLNISEATVSTHRKKMIKKLELNGPGQLQKLALHWIHSEHPQ